MLICVRPWSAALHAFSALLLTAPAIAADPLVKRKADKETYVHCSLVAHLNPDGIRYVFGKNVKVYGSCKGGKSVDPDDTSAPATPARPRPIAPYCQCPESYIAQVERRLKIVNDALWTDLAIAGPSVLNLHDYLDGGTDWWKDALRDFDAPQGVPMENFQDQWVAQGVSPAEVTTILEGRQGYSWNEAETPAIKDLGDYQWDGFGIGLGMDGIPADLGIRGGSGLGFQ